jgi:hypothetical protein
MKRNRIQALILLFTLAFGITACSNGSTPIVPDEVEYVAYAYTVDINGEKYTFNFKIQIVHHAAYTDQELADALRDAFTQELLKMELGALYYAYCPDVGMTYGCYAALYAEVTDNYGNNLGNIGLRGAMDQIPNGQIMMFADMWFALLGPLPPADPWDCD